MTDETVTDGSLESTDDGPPEPEDDTRPRIERALREVRRECWKAATLHAAVEAAVVFLAANLVLGVVEPSWLPARYPLPASVNDRLADALGGVGQLAVPGSATLAAALAVLAFGVGVGVRVRRPLVEQFEAANPPVREALRTARDAVDSDADSAMARRLYGDVLDRLAKTSGLALVDGRRVAVTVLVAALLSVATVQVAVADPALFDPADDAGEDGPAEPETNYTGLLDGDRVLGDSEAVEAGDEELNASVESTGGGQDVGEDQQFPANAGPATGASGDGVDSQQAGFAAPERVEDAELVREYNRRIRAGDGGGTDSSDGDGEGEGDASGAERGQNAGAGDT
ncbi:MAG: hypothetical protein V5A44_09405 [Haloarculaceae archaeon]